MTFAEDRIGPYMIEQWPDGIQVETYLPLLFEAERSFDEERAWVATFGDENWDEFDDALYFDALNTDNFRSRDSRNEYGEDALIYNELILEPHVPVHVVNEQRANLMGMTKAQLIKSAAAFGVTSLSMHMTKAKMVERIMELVPVVDYVRN
jgi:hypothetical protein